MRRTFIVGFAGPLAVAAAMSTAPTGATAVLTHGAFHRAGSSISALEQSSNWSGVAVTGGTYTRATGSWIVPKVKTTANNRFAADWVGIGGYSSTDLIQSGTSEESVGGHPNYYAWTEILPAAEVRITGFAIHPGDSMTVDVHQLSGRKWTITVTDHSSGQVFHKNLTYTSTFSSAEWIHEAPTVGGIQSQLATTNLAKFDLGTVNGSTAMGSAGTRHQIQLVGPTFATPSTLDSDNDGFAVKDGATAPPPPSS